MGSNRDAGKAHFFAVCVFFKCVLNNAFIVLCPNGVDVPRIEEKSLLELLFPLARLV